MPANHFLKAWLRPLVAAVLVAATPGAAQARVCTMDADCPRGFQCAGTDSSGASRTCTALECTSDADCATAFRCEFGDGTECVSESDGGQSCKPQNLCEPQWQPPCTTDADCGPGFGCTGSSGAFDCKPGADASVFPPNSVVSRVPCEDVAEPPQLPCPSDAGCPFKIPSICQPGTTCLAVSSKLCMPTASASVSCTVDSDCAPTWTCECPPAGGGAFDSAGGDSGTASGPCVKQCTAPNQDLSNGGLGPIFAGGNPPTSGSPSPTPSISDAGTTDEKRAA